VAIGIWRVRGVVGCGRRIGAVVEEETVVGSENAVYDKVVEIIMLPKPL